MNVTISTEAPGIQTVSIICSELNRIESITGYRPANWLMDIHNKTVNTFRAASGFDLFGFAIHIACIADSFIETMQNRYPNKRISFFC